MFDLWVRIIGRPLLAPSQTVGRRIFALSTPPPASGAKRSGAVRGWPLKHRLDNNNPLRDTEPCPASNRRGRQSPPQRGGRISRGETRYAY